MDHKPLRIALGDLRHHTLGRYSPFMPVGIGYIAAYLHKQLGGGAEIRLYEDPQLFLDMLDEWQPDVIALSSYCWNGGLDRYVTAQAKAKIPGVVCLAGGPEFPESPDECREFLASWPGLDFFVPHEAEPGVAGLVEKIAAGAGLAELKSQPQPGAMRLDPKTGELAYGGLMPRIMDLDEIPSPYLGGFMDQWFADQEFTPSMQIIRGCPFTCTYCFASADWYRRVTHFSMERVERELDYIVRKIMAAGGEQPNQTLGICDSNFGMYPLHEQAAQAIHHIEREYGWPGSMYVQIGRRAHMRIFAIADLLDASFSIPCSVQSMHEPTLQAIRRKNLPLKYVESFVEQVKNRCRDPSTEYIIPLPLETLQSFLEGIGTLVDAGIGYIIPYTLMMLKGTPLSSKESRAQFGQVTRFRVLPRHFGQYGDEVVVEVEEVCVTTDTFSFEDYLKARGYALLSAVLAAKQFDVIHRHLEDLGLKKSQYIEAVWRAVPDQKGTLSRIYRDFIAETEGELWETPERIFQNYRDPEEYQKLLDGRAGANLLKKYRTQFLLEDFPGLIELLYRLLGELAGPRLSPTMAAFLADSQAYVLATRNLTQVFGADRRLEESQTLELGYDVPRWYREKGGDPAAYQGRRAYRLHYQAGEVAGILECYDKLYGSDLYTLVPTVLHYHDVETFYKKCSPQ